MRMKEVMRMRVVKQACHSGMEIPLRLVTRMVTRITIWQPARMITQL